MARILNNYWKRQIISPKAGKCLGKAFDIGRELKQGNLTYPIIFNIVVDTVVQVLLDVVCSPEEAQHGMGWTAGERNLLLYINDVRVEGRDHECFQYELTVTVVMFCRMVIDANLKKTKAMACTPLFIWGERGETLHKQQAVGEGSNFRERKRMRVSCT